MRNENAVILRDAEGPVPTTGRIPLLTAVCAIGGALLLAIGCADDKKVAATRPGDAVLRDPFNYKPSLDESNISGGSLGHYDDKAMKKDLKSVFDP